MKPSRAKIAIVGGGAGGLLASLWLGESKSVELFEQNSSVGKKLLATGNGRCNITHVSASERDYFGESPSFAKEALERFGFPEFEAFCRSIGLYLSVREDGRCYPASNEAKSVLYALEESARDRGVKVHLDSLVGGLRRVRGTFELELSSGERFGGYEAVILATGSNAAPQLGGGEKGYSIAQSLGHTIAPLYPSLVQLHLDSPLLSRLAGVKCEGRARLWVLGKPVQEEEGDLLFTSYGISGFAILDLSQAASLALLLGQKAEIELDIAPIFTQKALQESLQNLRQSSPNRSILSILGGFISPKIAQAILKSLRIDPSLSLKGLAPKEIESILGRMKSWRFPITKTHGFKHAEVSGGGVRTSEIDPHTMESKRVKGLYIIGEMLDIVGKRGGYNLAFAWASAYLAARSLLTR